ncbi:MAG: CARDB domain-containing protein [Candidatus Bathyarchaeia archaeon]
MKKALTLLMVFSLLLPTFSIFTLKVKATTSPTSVPVEPQKVEPSAMHVAYYSDRLHKAVSYLVSQFNQSLNLCSEAPITAANTYWLVSDNLWAYKALEPYDSAISNAIKLSLIKYAKTYGLPTNAEGLPISYAHEAVVGEVVPLPFRTWNIYNLENNSYIIKTVVANGTVMEDWEEYADLLLYASLSSHWQGNQTLALRYFENVTNMWDGKGLCDKVFRNCSLYETYKLALLLFTSKVLKVDIPFEHDVIGRIWKQQDPITGGIITHYDLDGNAVGDTNTETTSIVVLSSPITEVEAEGSWVWVRNTITGDYGEAVVGTGDAIYIARKDRFYRYDPSDNSFAELAAPPKPDGSAFKTGTALAWDFGDHIYALCGAATGDSRRWFFRYSISTNSWEILANTPADQGEGNAIAWVSGENCIYATIGGEQRPTFLMRYDPSTNNWSDAPADPPAGMGDGASMVWTGGDYLYVLRGEFLEESPLCDFWRYSISQNAWNQLADIPAYPHSGGVGGVGDGGSLLYIGFWMPNQSDYIYALSGNQAHPEKPVIPDNRTYRYTISTNSWERLADLPFGVGYYVGCRLGFADGHIYAWQGAPSTWSGGGDDLARYEFPKVVDLSVNASVKASKIYYGQNTTLMVTVTNEGEKNVENPLVNIQLDSLVNLNWTFSGTIEPGKSLYRIFYIVTVGPAGPIKPGNYTIRVEVYPLEGEVETENNVCSLNLEVMPDNNAPSIGMPLQNPGPENVQPHQIVKVSVNVSDLESGVKNVTLQYKPDEGEWIFKLMLLNATTGMYEATIDGYNEGAKITYMIIAYDNAGNKAQQDNAGNYYIYTVIPELQLTSLSALILTTAIITLTRKRKIKQ